MSGPYAGDLSAPEAWELLERDPLAVLIDVRTEPEWRFVGVPDPSGIGMRTVCVSWQVYPDLRLNPDFIEQVAAAGVAPGQTLLLICRSGQRSRQAAVALTARGYSRCYNVADGFEGGHDEDRHRGTRAGWKRAGLPWRQE